MSFLGNLLQDGNIEPNGKGIRVIGQVAADNLVATRGNTYYVDSTNGSDSYSGRTPDAPLATLDAAINKCTANQGDIIYLLPGHTEALTGATDVVCDTAGITIVGIGSGSLTPKFTFGAAAAAIPVSAANVTFQNVVFEANFADVVNAFDLTTAKYFTLQDCKFQDNAAAKNFLSIVDTHTTNNAADGLKITGCSWITPDTETLSWIDVDADLDSLVFEDNYSNLGVNSNDYPSVAIVATGKDLTNVQIRNNVLIRLNDANPLIATFDTTTANTGVVADNYLRHADTAGELLLTAGSNIGQFENKATAVINASGYILPAVDS